MRRLGFLMLCLGIFSGTYPADARELSLADAVSVALSGNLDAIIASERVNQAVQRLHQARTQIMPNLSSEFSWDRQTRNLSVFGFETPDTQSVVGPYNVYDARLRLTQTIFDRALIRRLHTAGLGRDLSRADERRVREDVMALAATLYIDAQRAQEALVAQKSQAAYAHIRFRVALTRYRQGSGSLMEMIEARTALMKSRAQWRILTSAYHDRLLELKSTLGISIQESITLAQPHKSEMVEWLSADAMREAVGVHPALEKLRVEKAYRQSQADAEWSEFWPKLSLTTDIGQIGRETDAMEETYSIGLKLSVPLFDGGLRIGRAKEAVSRVREIEASLTTLMSTKEADSFRSKDTVKNARTMLASAWDSWEYARRWRELIRTRWMNGTASRVAWLEARAAESRALDAFLEAQAAYRVSQIQFLHALGRMQTLMERNL